MFYTYEYLLRILPNVMVPQIMDHYDITNTTYGVLFAFYYWAYVPMQLLVGLLMDQYGPRRLLTFACGMCVFGTYLFVASEVLWVAYLGRFLVGFGSAFAFVGVLKLASIWLPASRFAMFTGMASALGTLGVGFGEIVLTSMLHSIGWVCTVITWSVIGIIITVLLWMVIRDHESGNIEDQNSYHEIDWKTAGKDLKNMLLNSQMWIAGAIGCLIYLPTTAFAEAWGIRYLENAQDFTPAQAAFGISLLFTGFTIGAPFFGWLSDFVKTRRRLLLVGSFCALMLALVLFYVQHLELWHINVLLFCLGLSYSVQCLVFVIARELTPDHASGTAVAVMNMMVMLGGMIFQPVIAVLLDWVGNPDIVVHLRAYSSSDYRIAFSVIPLGIAVSFIFAMYLKETYGTNDVT